MPSAATPAPPTLGPQRGFSGPLGRLPGASNSAPRPGNRTLCGIDAVHFAHRFDVDFSKSSTNPCVKRTIAGINMPSFFHRTRHEFSVAFLTHPCRQQNVPHSLGGVHIRRVGPFKYNRRDFRVGRPRHRR